MFIRVIYIIINFILNRKLYLFLSDRQSCISRSETMFNKKKTFKNDKKWFLFHLEAFFVLNVFLSSIYGRVERWLD